MIPQPKLHILLDRQDIDETIMKLATRINDDYMDKSPIMIGILKGAFMFMADLIRHLKFSPTIDFIQVSSYGRGKESQLKIRLVHELRIPIRDKHVLIIEDIVDTGRTQAFLLDYLQKKQPASIKLCVLTDKPSRRVIPVKIDYLGFTIPNKFIVGYGIDWNERFRNLPDICYIED